MSRIPSKNIAKIQRTDILMLMLLLFFFFFFFQGSEHEQHQWDWAKSLPPTAPVVRTVSTKSFNSHSVNKPLSSQLTHDKKKTKQLFLKPLICVDLCDGDWWLWPASDLFYQESACSNRQVDPGMAAQKKGGKGNLIFTQRANIWSLKCSESLFCAQHPSRCFLALLDFVSAGQLSRSSTHIDTCLCQDKHTL